MFCAVSVATRSGLILTWLMAFVPSLVPLTPIGGEEAEERAWEFILAHVSRQEGRGIFPILKSVSAYGIPERISHMFGGETNSPAYKACTSHAASRTNCVRTAQIRRLTLRQAAHADSTTSLLGYGQSHWPGAQTHVFKAALVRGADATPVETARTSDDDALAGLVAEYFKRLREAGHALPHCSTDTSSVFVDAVLRAALHAPVEWTGRVSRTWVPHDEIEPIFPLLADRVGIAQAITYDGRSSGSGGFTWMKCQQQYLVGFGPSPTDQYYLHRPLLRPAKKGQSTAAIEQLVRERVAELDALEDPLTDYVPERMLVHPSRDASFEYVLARILLTWQFPRWSSDSKPREGPPERKAS